MRSIDLQLFAEDPQAGSVPSGDETVQDAAGHEDSGAVPGPDAGDEGSESEVSQDAQPTRTYTDEDVQRIIRERLKKERKYREAVERMAQAVGMDPDQVIEQINQLVAMRGTAPAAPTPTTTASAAAPFDPAAIAQAAGQVALETRREMEVYQLRQNPVYQPILDDEEKREELIQHANRRGLSLKEAFWQLYGEEVAQRLARDAERRALENARKRAALTAESDDAVQELQKLGLTPEEVEFARRIGMDPKEYAILKEATTLDQYHAKLGKR